jgi:hypothetical protein
MPPLDDAIRRYLEARPPRRRIDDDTATAALLDSVVGALDVEGDPDADAVGVGAFGDE